MKDRSIIALVRGSPDKVKSTSKKYLYKTREISLEKVLSFAYRTFHFQNMLSLEKVRKKRASIINSRFHTLVKMRST